MLRLVLASIAAALLPGCLPSPGPPDAGDGGGGPDGSIPPVEGDRCEAPFSLAFTDAGAAGLVASATGSLDSFSGDYLCHFRTGSDFFEGPDVIYSFTTAADTAFVADVHDVDAGTSVSVSLQRTCGEYFQGCGPLAQVDPRRPRVRPLPAGTWFLAVDGAADSQYVLAASLKPLRAGETCPEGIGLDLSDGGVASVTDDTVTAFDDDGDGTPELAFTFPVHRDRAYRLQLSALDGGWSPRGTWFRGSQCLGTGTVFSAPGLEAVAYADEPWSVAVDSADGSTGSFLLTAAELLPGAGDRCDLAIPLSLSGGPDGGTAQVTGDVGAGIPGVPLCIQEAQVVYSFTIGATRNLSATVWPTLSTFRPNLGVGSIPCTGTAALCESAPQAGWGVTLSATGLPPGTYHVVVSGPAGAPGPFILTVTLS